MRQNRNGFSIAEILVTIAVMGAIVTVSWLYLFQYRKVQIVNTAARESVFFIRNAVERATTQENGSAWGIHFLVETVDQGGMISSFILFEGLIPTLTNIRGKLSLDSSLEFQNAVPDVAFEQRTGQSSAEEEMIFTIRIKGSNCATDPSRCRSVKIYANGVIEAVAYSIPP